MNAINLHSLAAGFHGGVLFRSGEISLAGGGCYPLLGRNGAGKSTLLRVLAGLQPPAEGTFELHGRVLYQPQKPAVFRMSALENAMIGMMRPDKFQAAQTLATVGLEAFAGAPAKTLSGGEQQRLCLARSLLTGGEIFLLDEPFSAVDSKSVAGLERCLQAHCQQHSVTMIMATHSLQQAARFSAQCLLLHESELALCGVPEARAALAAEWD